MAHLQVSGDLFVIGDGDCGQFGLGEDVMEAPRPAPTVAGGQQVTTHPCLPEQHFCSPVFMYILFF